MQNKKKMKYYDHHLRPLLYMLLSSVTLSIVALIGKLAGAHLILPLLIFIRFFAPAVFLFIYIAISERAFIRKQPLHIHIVRAVCVVLSQYAFFFYLIHSNLFNATLLLMTGPFFIPILERVFYKEKIDFQHAGNIAIGFIGVACILKPTHGLINWHALIGLSAGFFNACSQILFYHMSKQYKTFVNMFFLYLFTSVIALFILLFFYSAAAWQQESLALLHWHEAYLLTLLGIFVIINQYFRSKAYEGSKRPLYLTPVLFLSVFISGIFDWIFFYQTPHANVWIGAVLIITNAAVMTILRAHEDKVIHH